jgi:hypothetical protein
MEEPTLYFKIQQQLSDRNLKVVSERTGIKQDKLWRIMTGRTKRPNVEEVEKLMQYLEV